MSVDARQELDLKIGLPHHRPQRGEEGGQEAAGSEHGDSAQGLKLGPGDVAHSGHARGRAPLHLGLHLLPQVHYNDT